MHKTKITEIFLRFEAGNPSPETELQYVNNFTLLVAVVLSAQSTDKGVNKATKNLFKIADCPKKMLALGEDTLRQHIKTIGLFNSKAKNIIKLCAILVENHNSIVPNTMEQLIKLPGVGRKTANVILNTAFKKPVMAVDTHIFRVSNRIGLADAKDVLQTEAQLLKNIPKAFLLNAHHWLILHGRYICKSRRPLCQTCPIEDLCEYPKKPIKSRKKPQQ